LTDVVLISLGRDNFKNIFGDKVQSIIFKNLQRWSYDKSVWLKYLTNIQKEKL